MADLYEQLGQDMSSAVEHGSKGTRFWELDQIQQMYDIKRKRMERLFNTLGYGIEAATRIGDIHSRNSRLSDFAESKGYEVDTGFLGIGKPRYFKPAEELDSMSGPSDSLGQKEEVSAFEMFGIDNPDFSDLFKLGGE